MNTELTKAVEKHFSPVIGMEKIKKSLVANLNASLDHGGGLLSPIFIAPPGTGKSRLCEALRDLHLQIGTQVHYTEPKNFRLVDGPGWGPLLNFLSENPGQRKLLIVDEVHEMWTESSAQTQALETWFRYSMDSSKFQSEHDLRGTSVFWDRRIHQVVIATNLPGKVAAAIAGKTGRAYKMHLPLYSEDECTILAKMNLEKLGIRGHEDSLRTLSRVVRGSARVLRDLCDVVVTQALNKGKDTVNKEDIKAGMLEFGRFPLGFEQPEIEALHFMQRPAKLNMVAARFPSFEPSTLRDFVSYALSHALIFPQSGGYTLSEKGRRYFKDAKSLGFPVPTLD